ncbi:TPA: valine--tRNA ligase [archaeon]|uniref:Valine--tRNA ligase n=1 Tax=Candidatus Undinarchaeum marinum TaxID=2756141 RepID=A0A832V8M9_9ARCH|nr:valine--tRNA ligase [Candidatus Undinarchaeum marinum]
MAEKKIYDPKEAEQRLQEFWDSAKIYKFDPKSKKPIFSIDTPPPTVSGEMHIGHTFSYSQMDFIARYKRMRGYNLFYPFGTDDNGIATNLLVEKIKGVKAEKIGREKFIKMCLKVLEDLRPKYIQDWKKIGMSCDWSLFYSTIDEHSRRISQKSFIDLYLAGHEYRKEAPITWCPKCTMAVSQVEMDDKDFESTFSDIIFKLEDGSDLVISTTRPELLSSCVSIFIHPDDKKSKKLLGKKVIVPLFNQEVEIREDSRVDPDKGTGIVMCCTFGDLTDIEWYLAHNLELIESIGKDGKMTESAGKYAGMKIDEARKAILSDLKASKLIKSQKEITHSVNTHERCGTTIEIINSVQWFIKYLHLKDKFIEIGNQLNWTPEFMKNRYDNWVGGLQWDWCISRQRYFGVPIPVWYCTDCEEILLPDEKDLPIDPLKDSPKKPCKCGSKNFIPEKDTLDTWATSSLTPQLAIGLHPKLKDKLFPMDLRPQAHDIIAFWLFNTVVKSHFHEDSLPWKDVTISGWALDPRGRKMSKSRGNVIRPQDMIEKYSADAIRFWAAGSKLGDDMPFQEKDLVTGVKFVNKMWNATKFSNMHLEDYKEGRKTTRVLDKWLLSKLAKLVKESTESFDVYAYSKAKSAVESFYLATFCDNYLEIAKDRLYNPDKYGKDERTGAQYTLREASIQCIKMMAPFMPHITEELYQIFFKKGGSPSIHLESWPEFDKSLIDEKSEKTGDFLVSIVAAVRQYKQGKGLSLGTEIRKLIIDCDEKLLKPILLDLQGASRALSVETGKGSGDSINLSDGTEVWIEE